MRQSLSESVIRARGLHKHYGPVRALDGLDLTVSAGEVHGFLGPNGAGKSTVIRAILGQLALTAGELTVLGGHPRADAPTIHRRLAYVAGDTALWPHLTGGECIDVIAGFRGDVHTPAFQRRRGELIDRFELDPTRRARTYSKGNRQKVALIAALSADVDLYLLDEPTSGLDPLMEAVFQETVGQLRERGRTVLLSSHILDEVEALCDRVTIIRGGRTVSTGTLDDLRAHTQTVITVTTDRSIAGLAAIAGVTDLTERIADDADGAVHTRLRCAATALADVIAAIGAHRPRALTVRPPSLDEMFLEQYRTQPTSQPQPEPVR
nr:ABC transporter ATP-binding protein [Millisia brevis]